MLKKNANLLVYTAIFGQRDRLRSPKVFAGVDYVCFTDDPALRSDIWKIVLVSEQGEPRRLAKIYKILPHRYFPDYEYSLWVDGSHLPTKNPWELVHKFLSKRDAALFAHQNRNCLYDEAKHCLSRELDAPQFIVDQIAKYQQEGYPRHNGLATCTIVLRRHNQDNLKKAMEDWWQEICTFSSRDQISFNYIMRKHNLPYAVIPGNVYYNGYFSAQFHVGEEWMAQEKLPFLQRYLYFAERIFKESR